MDKKIRLGVLGATRGLEIIQRSSKNFDNVEISVICDTYKPVLEHAGSECLKMGKNVRLTDSFDELLKDDTDAIILANYANEHAPYAIKALKAGKHVMSEVLPVQNMAEAVQLTEAVENSGKVYAYSEQYCYFDSVFEIRLRYESGEIGKANCVEGDFIHDCSSKWPRLTRGGINHWRNHVPSTFYCTHSIGPLLFITQERAKTVIGIEMAPQQYMVDVGARSGSAAMEIMQLTNGVIAKSKHGNLRRPWLAYYEILGENGLLEKDKNSETVFKYQCGKYDRDGIYSNITPQFDDTVKSVKVNGETPEQCALRCFIGTILGDEVAKKYVIDIYQALDMSLPGILAYRSILNGNIPIEVPDFRNKQEREKYRYDVSCTDITVAKDRALPSNSFYNINLDISVYEKVNKMFLDNETD